MLTLDLLTPSSPPYAKGRGIMVVLSSPSGAGKSSTSRAILAADPNLSLSVSATTRAMRPGEQDGLDYHFISHAAFEEMINQHAFLEYAEVFGNYYGTPKAPVMAALRQGRDVLFDVDWQGAQQMKAAAPDDMVSIFLLPPSVADLFTRLKARAQDSAATVAKRMQGAYGEIQHWAEYDYVLVNRDLEETIAAVEAIIAAERLKRWRQNGLSAFADDLLGQAEKLKP